MKKHWVLGRENPKLRDKIIKALGLSAVTAQVLVNRGIENEAEAEQFVRGSLFDLPSPYLLKGMDHAVERLKTAIGKKEKIAIYGDYDVDGITATALFHNFLYELGASVTYYNPDRIKEGYGVNTEAIRKLQDEGVSLIISGDCGITARKEVEEAKKLNIDFIITDHHEPPEMIPDAVSVLNPHQVGCSYPAKEITGVGVIFNLAIALRRSLRDSGFFRGNEPNLGDYLDLVALGTLADCAPLTNINRIFVKEGIKRMSNPKRPGILALKEVSGIKDEVNSFDLGFKLAPRVNSSGRLDRAGVAVELLITKDVERARELAGRLNQENSKRQSIEQEIFLDAVSEIESKPHFLDSNSLVLASPRWHPGVIGIVASRLVERYQRPAILIAIGEDGIGKGSGRSIEGMNIYSALSECRELFEKFGGHELAAGMSIREYNIDAFKEMFEKAIEKSGGHQAAKVKIDCTVNLADVSDSVVSELNLLAPFGIGNQEPFLLAKSAAVISQRTYKDKHLGLKLRHQERAFDAIWFNLKERITLPDKIDAVFTPEYNNWNGKKEIRLRIIDADW